MALMRTVINEKGGFGLPFHIKPNTTIKPHIKYCNKSIMQYLQSPHPYLSHIDALFKAINQ